LPPSKHRGINITFILLSSSAFSIPSIEAESEIIPSGTEFELEVFGKRKP
jgi:hypothetical protein